VVWCVRCFDLDSALIDVDDSFSIPISIPVRMVVSKLSAALFSLNYTVLLLNPKATMFRL
jgi:hypothetical protein